MRRDSISYKFRLTNMNAFFNKYDKLIYIIQTFCRTESSHRGIINDYFIYLDIFKNNKVKTIYYLEMKQENYILYENEISNGYNIIFIDDFSSSIKSIQLETIKEKKKKQLFFRTLLKRYDFNDCYLGCRINFNDKICYLYFFERNKVKHKSNLISFDLNKNMIVKPLELNLEIYGITNWLNKYLIINSYNSFYLFNLKTEQIILKYNLNLDDRIESMLQFIDWNNKFIGLFFLNNNRLECFSIDR